MQRTSGVETIAEGRQPMADYVTINTAANILIACALAVIAYSLGGKLGIFGNKATQHALAWYFPDVVLGIVTILYLGDFGPYLNQSAKLGFAYAVTARLAWRGLLMWRVYRQKGELGARTVNMFCVFAVGALAAKAWQCAVVSDVNRAGLQGINQLLGIICLCWAIPAMFWLVSKPQRNV